MKYLITGETKDSKRNVSPEEFAHILERGIVLTLEAYNNLGFKKKIIINNTSAIKGKTGVAIVEGDSHEDVNKILGKFPSWLKVKWTVMPLN